MNFSIIIPAYNSATTLPACLEACRNQDYGTPFEVIVVNDGSTDRTAEIAGHYPAVCISQDNAGPAAARNTGWRRATGSIICFTDADCVPESGWLRRIDREFSREQAAAVGGGYTYKNPGVWGSAIHREISRRHAGMQGYTNFLGSFNLSVQRAALEKIGGFNETYLRASGEDNDLSYRLAQQGCKLFFNPEITVEHRHYWTLAGYLRSQLRHGYWRMKLYREHPKMRSGDAYAGGPEFLLPPLAMAAVATGLAGWWRPAFILLAVMGVLCRQRDLPLAVLWFLRAFFRGFGMLAGFVRFWMFPPGSGSRP
jgi:glycosyltransferase involved in cell wall biosynthesis